MTKETTIIALIDGFNNCWSIVENLAKDCKEIIKIVYWFHIGKKFKKREKKVPAGLIEQYSRWHEIENLKQLYFLGAKNEL